MAFKEGDIVIYVGNINDSSKNLEIPTHIQFGKKYKVISTEIDDFVMVQKIEGEYYFNTHDSSMSVFASSDEFIHPDDWVRRLKYGV